MERFVLGPEIGRGGMGRVHHAWDPMLRRRVALKLLPGGDAEHQLRFLREARNQAKIDHPNVCRIHDLGLDGDRPYIAMQLIPGPTLSELRPELDARQVAGLMAAVAGGIQAAHLAGLIHRDLKPANILVVGHGSGQLAPFVVDFGLARDLQAQDQTLSWAVMGTPAFMSPEQARGEALGPATDIYSLGATLYAMLSGHPPHEVSTLGGLLESQAESGVRRIRKLDPAIPRDLETIALKCLESDPAARYASARAVQEDLQRFLAGEPILARPVGPIGHLSRWMKRKPALAATAAAGLLATLVLGGWNLRTLRQARLREQAAQRFAMEIRDAEHLLRIERMLPIHDIRPAEARLRARMAEISQGMERLGGIARGPGLYALGRGHLALNEFEVARASLKGAWDSGFQAPEVAYAIGFAMLDSYQDWKLRLGPEKPSSESLAKARRELLEPGIRWLERADGAKVDHPSFAKALVASSLERYEEADALYTRTLEDAPWLFEAWVGKATNFLNWKSVVPRQEVDEIDRNHGLAIEMLRTAQRLAPSDEEARLAEAKAVIGLQMLHSARDRREEAPMRESQRILDEVSRVRPGSMEILLQSTNISLQRGFLQLSQGGDPAPMLRERVQPLLEIRDENRWRKDLKKTEAVAALHHLFWVIAEADWRFGRDPRPALAEARKAREAFNVPDQHFVFPLLVEAQYLRDRGRDPGPVFAEAEALIDARLRDPVKDAFIHSIHGELVAAKARWLLDRRGTAEDLLLKGIASVERGLQLESRMAYLYYSLPVLHALRARAALAQGKDPEKPVQAALRTARRGLEINPANAQLRLAAAEASLAEARALVRRNANPNRSLEDARRHLDAGGKVNPRDFRLELARAEVEWEQFVADKRVGKDGGPALGRLRQSCRHGLTLKADEPRFREFQVRAAEN